MRPKKPKSVLGYFLHWSPYIKVCLCCLKETAAFETKIR